MNINNQFPYKRMISYVLISVLICSISLVYISSSSSSNTSSIKATNSRQLLSKNSQTEEKTKNKRSSKKSKDTAPSPSKDYTLPTLPTVYIPTIWSPSPYPTYKPTGIL
jgi:sortase (surface protein transpeptidase)